ncbi:VOC family protein [Bacillus pacificus]
MHFRLELFVEDLQRSIRFYEEILTLVFSKKNTTGAMIKLGDFFFIIDP